jgi:HAD superfamily hydrolase (TIGR01490 family)
MAIAFFDLDKTLLARNSGAMWVRAELQAGNLTMREAFFALRWLGRYRLGSKKIERALRASMVHLEGKLESEVRERARGFYAREVRGLFRPGGLEALARHREAGDRLVLLTSTTNYLADAVAAELDLDGVLCNRFEVDRDGRYTGRPIGPLCFGAGKVELAREYAARVGLPLGKSAFYSDSATDMPMLEVVGSPVAVNPDPRLWLHARKRGWQIVDWGEPARQG